MPMIAGLFRSAEDAARVLQEIRLARLGICVEDIRVAGSRLDGLELFDRERKYRHERTRSTNAVLVTIQSDTVDLAALRDRLAAAGMEILETQYSDPPSGYSEYPYGTGVRPAGEAPADAAGEKTAGPEAPKVSQDDLNRDYY